jgi:hypothetical protein
MARALVLGMLLTAGGVMAQAADNPAVAAGALGTAPKHRHQCPLSRCLPPRQRRYAR